MASPTALILFAHGARDARWALPFEAVASAVRQHRPDLLGDLLDRKGFWQELDIVDVYFLAQLFLGIAGHEQDPEIRTGGPDPLGQFPPVHFGHDHVGDDEVRLEPRALAREHPAGAPDARLHLVEDEEEVVAVADLPHPMEVVGGGDHHSPLALDRLHHERDDVGVGL